MAAANFNSQLGALYQQEGRALRAWARVRFPFADAEVLVQDAFVALVRRGTIADIKCPGAFLHCLIEKAAASSLRSKYAQKRAFRESQTEGESMSPSSEEEYQVIDLAERIQEVLGRLSPRDRRLVSLSASAMGRRRSQRLRVAQDNRLRDAR